MLFALIAGHITKTKEWVACHRKHHAFADREGDPHSPLMERLRNIVLKGAFYYRKAVWQPGVLEKYGNGTPNDWIERHLLAPRNWLGIALMLGIDLWLFGWVVGPAVWGVQLLWIPFWAAGIVNGVGHAFAHAGDARETRGERVRPMTRAGDDPDACAVPALDRREHRRGGSARSEHDDHAVIVRQAEVPAHGGVEPSDVGVVADEGATLRPERVHGAHALGDGTARSAERRERLLVRHGHVAGGIGVAQKAGDGREPCGRDVERFVRQRDSCAQQCGGLQRRGERVRDGVAEQHEPPGKLHYTAPLFPGRSLAMRSNTSPTMRSSSSAVER